jgi:hypothetical protein
VVGVIVVVVVVAVMIGTINNKTTMDPLVSCPGKLRHCPVCPRSNVAHGVVIRNPEGNLYDGKWCKTLCCRICKTEWHVCTECSKIKTHLLISQSLRNHYRTFHIMDYKGYSVNDKRLLLIRSRLKREIQDDLEIESLESLDDDEAEEISVLKDKEDELLEELLDDTNSYSAEENEYYSDQEADTDKDGSDIGSVFDGEDAMSYQFQDKYANDLPVNPHENIAPSVEARNFDREETI